MEISAEYTTRESNKKRKATTGIWIPLKQIGGIPIKDENNRQLYYCTSCGLPAFLGNYCSNCGSANQMEVIPNKTKGEIKCENVTD